MDPNEQGVSKMNLRVFWKGEGVPLYTTPRAFTPFFNNGNCITKIFTYNHLVII